MNLRPLTLAVPFALVVVAVPVRGEEPKTHTVVVRPRWKAGDVATLEYGERRTMAILKVVDGKTVDEESFKENRVVEVKALSKCLAADAKGFPTKIVHYFAAWKISDGDKQAPDDVSLAKVHVQVDGVGTARTITVLTPGAQVSEQATGWLEEEFGKGDKTDAIQALLEPASPVAVGATWKPSVAEIAKLLGGADGPPADETKMSADATFRKLDGTKAELEFGLVPAMKGFPAGDALLAWKSGGTGKITINARRDLKADAKDLAFDKSDEFDGIADGKTFEIHFALKAQTRSVLTSGGAFPDVPAGK